jgi:FkbM family methyltransferase
MRWVKSLLYRALLNLVRLFGGTGLGRLLRPLGAIVDYLLRVLMTAQECQVFVNDYRMLLPVKRCKDRDPQLWQILETKTWEPHTTILFKQSVKKGMNVIDVGAHVGYFTLLAAGLVGDMGNVFAFEPAPENYEFLVKNIKLNGYNNVVPVQKAAASEAGKVKLYLSKVCSGWHTLYKKEEAYAEYVMVDAVSIDEFLRDKRRHIGIIKIDVEGAELSVLSGMTETCRISDDLKLFIEFNPPLLRESDTDLREYWDKLIELGFQHILLIDELRQKLEIADLQTAVAYCKQNAYVNLLCLKSACTDNL